MPSRLLRRPGRLVIVVVAALAVAAGVAVALDRTVFAGETQAARPDLQRILDRVVAGPSALAPGATAYVSGPRGTWLGAAGVADVRTRAPMPADARMRLESISKIYTAALVQLLAHDGRLRVGDTVERWLPGLLPDGRRITIRQLLTMTSGLIDNNDFTNASESVVRGYLARVKDAKLRTELLAAAALVARDPSAEVPETLWVRWAAWQPLLFAPGAGYHYSNIGYDVLGLIAEHAAGEPLATLYRERIFEPLGLRASAYDPQGPIAGAHARGYTIASDGTRTDASDRHWGVGAEGGVVADARDTGAFLTALMRGDLVDRGHVVAMEADDLWRGGAPSGCAGRAYGWSGGGSGYKSEVWVDDGGTRVAVLLLDARHVGAGQAEADSAANAAMAELYCAA